MLLIYFHTASILLYLATAPSNSPVQMYIPSLVDPEGIPNIKLSQMLIVTQILGKYIWDVTNFSIKTTNSRVYVAESCFPLLNMPLRVQSVGSP